MATARSERPRFFEGQYIGAADLAATVDYTRELARELALAGQSWGICIGLDLVEVANAAGGFDYFVLPGLAFDGYGRPIVVLAPAPVSAGLFADFPTGNQPVWIRYDEAENRGLRPGWESCDASDAYARVRESYAIEAGPKTAVKDRQSGVDIAGAQVEDARLALNAIDADAPLICDASVPHQTFPADTARWLVPVGAAAWTAGVPGALAERSADAKKASRALRRYVGQIAESVYAADGVLRLRDRKTDRDDTKTPDEQCAASSVTIDDLSNATDPKDPTVTIDRLIGKELVWVEGHMRVTGDARLWGTRLEFRDAKGSDGGVPLHMNRGATANAEGGQDLELALGADADGKTRLIAGVAAAGQPLAAKLQLKNDGRLGVGTIIPADVKSHTILAHTEGDTSIAIAAAANKLAKLQFATDATLTETAHLAWDDSIKRLRIGAGGTIADYVYMTPFGKVGLRTATPDQQDADANDLVVYSPSNVGMTLQCDPGLVSRINFSDGVADPADRHAGSVVYNHTASRMELWTAAAMRVSVDASGNIGLGTLTPGARLQVQSLTDARQLKIDADRIQAENGGPPSQLAIQPNGGGMLIGGSLGIEQQMIFGADGRVGLGVNPPGAALHLRRGDPHLELETTSGTAPRLSFSSGGIERSRIEMAPGTLLTHLISNGATTWTASGGRLGVNTGGAAPITNLHVRGSIDADAGTPQAHVAFIENVAGGSADVLALRVNLANPDSSNNFITFFGSGGPVGRIEGAGGNSVSFQTSGADFAECLVRSDNEPIGPGRIVGVRAGRVTLETDGADALLVTTDRAAVVGNAPMGDRGGHETVAMMGQVPVFVRGPVRSGDFVVASGAADGTGRAIPARELGASETGRRAGLGDVRRDGTPARDGRGRHHGIDQGRRGDDRRRTPGECDRRARS